MLERRWVLGDPLSNWFEAQGISPLVGGVLLGGSLAFLLFRASKKTPRASFELPRVPAEQPLAAARGDVKEQALELVRGKNKIEAIKLVRERTGLGLKEAKDQVEAWERESKGLG